MNAVYALADHDLPEAQWLRRFVQHIPYPLTYVDRDCRLVFVNLAYQRAIGLPASQLIGRPIGEARGPARWAEHKPYFERAFAGESVQYTRLVQRNDHPHPRWTRTSYVPDIDDGGHVRGVYTVTVDVHDLTEAQRRLTRSAERDALTDALSRRTMMERLDVATASSDQQPVALYFLDLDGFKALNDRLGHASGDALLVALARALQGAVRQADAVGRFGGDEFLVLAHVHDAAGAAALAEHLLAATRDCVAGCAKAGPVSASIGYALAPQDATQPLRLLQLADDAMYAAKRAGKDRAVRCNAAAG